MPSTRVALVIPVIDEDATIAGVGRAVPRDVIDEIIVVDGGSRDGTVAAARGVGARVIVEPRAGYGAACLVGVAAAADCAVIAFIDGDGSDDPADLGRIVGPILAGEQDFVIGSRAGAAQAAGSKGGHPRVAGGRAARGARAAQYARAHLRLESGNADARRARSSANPRTAGRPPPPRRRRLEGRR